jgi:glycerol uptake facilitator protein
MPNQQELVIEDTKPQVEIAAPAPASLLGQCSAEFIGTFIVIFVGNGAGAAASLVNQLDGWGVAMMWGLAVTFGIYVAGTISGAHFNPAVTLTMAVFRGFPKHYILPFIASQIAGAYVASACLYFFWHNFIAQQAVKLGVAIGAPGSQKIMSIFSCFYPSPGVGTDEAAWAMISTPQAFGIEVILTAFLLIMIFALTEPENTGMPQAGIGPLFIGLTVTAIVGIGGNLTMDAVNPVRDFGPRLFAYTIGFGNIAFPGPRGNEWWLYILAPIIGGLLGAVIYRYLVLRFLPRAA